MNSQSSMKKLAALAMGLAGILLPAKAMAQSHGAAITSGNAMAFGGSMDADGLHGVYSGPEGSKAIFRSAKTANGVEVHVGDASAPQISIDLNADPSEMVHIAPPSATSSDDSFSISVATPQGKLALSSSAMRDLADARRAFRHGDFAAALRRLDRAAKWMADDRDLLQLRSLALFAMKDYRHSADFARRALASKAFWSWDELKALYPERDLYAEQLRALEEMAKAKPGPDHSLLLAYHYLMLHHLDAARGQLLELRRLMPKDPLAADLLERISSSSDAPPAPGFMPDAR